MVHMIESAGERLPIAADFANHPAWSLEHPDWEVKFDTGKSAAAATRRRLLDMMAAKRLPFVGYHMPWPGTGFVETAGDGYREVPTSYQPMLRRPAALIDPCGPLRTARSFLFDARGAYPTHEHNGARPVPDRGDGP